MNKQTKSPIEIGRERANQRIEKMIAKCGEEDALAYLSQRALNADNLANLCWAVNLVEQYGVDEVRTLLAEENEIYIWVRRQSTISKTSS